MPGSKGRDQTKNEWQSWEKAINNFKKVKKIDPPDTTYRHWRRYLLFIFMQELSKHVFNPAETFDSILKRIAQAFYFGCGFERIRVYLVKKNNKGSQKLYLYQTIVKTKKVKKGKDRELPLKPKKKEDAVETLSSKKPLIADEAKKLDLKFKKSFNISGPYVAVPLFIKKDVPYGLICADTASISSDSEEDSKSVRHIEYKEHFLTFAYAIMAAIDNWEMFYRSSKEFTQLEKINEFNEIIQSETNPEKLLMSFVEHSVNQVDADGGHLKIYNKKTDKLETVAGYGADLAPPEIKSKPKALGFSNWVYKQETPLLINDLTAHPLQKKLIRYYKNEGNIEYIKRLSRRKSALIVPLKIQNKEVFGVLDLHSEKKNQFNEAQKENLQALAGSVMYAIDKVDQLERRDSLIKTREQMLSMLQKAVEEAHDLSQVLKTILDNLSQLEYFKNLKHVCLILRNQQTNQLIPPSVKCKNPKAYGCISCMKNKTIIKKAFDQQQEIPGSSSLALPILKGSEAIGVLYLQAEKKFDLNDDIKKLLKIITNTTAILILMAIDYSNKIKQSKALYKAGQLSKSGREFQEWFNPIMDIIMEIIGPENRNFYLVLAEKENGRDEELFIRGTSPLTIKGETISTDSVLGTKLSIKKSLAGFVYKTKRTQKIDIEYNRKLKNDHPEKRPYHKFRDEIKSEVGFPLMTQEAGKEKVLGVLLIDSQISKDFQGLDFEFYETVANYIATAIHNQQLYQERVKFQKELSTAYSTHELSIVLNSFLNGIRNPLSEVNSAINLIQMTVKEKTAKKYIQKATNESRRLLSTFDEFVFNFVKNISKRNKIGIKDLITNTLQTAAKTKKMGLQISGNYRDKNFKFYCYPAYIELALLSIIDDAITYSQDLKIASEKTLNISVTPSEDNTWFSIVLASNTSSEIPSDKLNSYFEPFKEERQKESTNSIGLNVAALGIMLHNGTIKVENVTTSNGKKAVRFEILLPMGREFKLPGA